MRKRRRSRRGSNRERKALNASLKVFLTVILVIGMYLLLTSDIFVVRNVTITGLNHLTATEIQDAAGLSKQVFLWEVWPWRVRATLKELPRVAEAKVFVGLPNMVAITVQERVPMALVVNGGAYLEVDGEGCILSAQETVESGDLPLITGVRVAQPEPGVIIRDNLFQRALNVLLVANGTIPNRVSEVHVEPSGEVVIYTIEGIPVYLGVRQDFRSQVQALAGIIKEFANLENLDYIDLRSSRRPVVRTKFSSKLEKGNH